MDDVDVPKVEFTCEYVLCKERHRFSKYLDRVVNHTEEKEHIPLLEKILKHFEKTDCEPDKDYIRNILVEYFIRYSPKKCLKQQLLEFLKKEKGGVSLLNRLIDSVRNDFEDSVYHNSTFNVRRCHQITTFIHSYINHLSNEAALVDIGDRLFELYYFVLDVVASQAVHHHEATKESLSLSELPGLITTHSKHLLVILVKTDKTPNQDICLPYADRFINSIYAIFQHFDILPASNLLILTFVYANFLKRLAPIDRQFIIEKHRDYPVLAYCEHEEEDFFLQVRGVKLYNVFKPVPLKIYLCCAIYTSIGDDALRDIEIGGRNLLEWMIMKLVECSKSVTLRPYEILVTTKGLCDLAKYLDMAVNIVEVFEVCLELAFAHLDHFFDSLMHIAKTFLGQLAKHAVHAHKNGDSSFLLSIFDRLNSLPIFAKARLAGLFAISEVVDGDLIMENFKDVQRYLIRHLRDANLASTACGVYGKLMQKGLSQSSSLNEFKLAWLTPIIENLNNAEGENVDKHISLVKEAFLLKPEIFPILFPADYVGTTNENVIILQCLGHARKHGVKVPIELDGNDKDYWRDLILKKRLEQFMVDQDDKVRLGVLQLLVDCQKTTELITDWEMTFYINFFSYNVAIPKVAFANKLRDLYLKLFQRFVASLKVVQRNIDALKLRSNDDEEARSTLEENQRIYTAYRCFFKDFLACLVSNVKRGVNKYRLGGSLSLLYHLKGVATVDEWKATFPDETMVTIRDTLISDISDDLNRCYAVDILKNLDLTALGFGSSKSASFTFYTYVEMSQYRYSKYSSVAPYLVELCLFTNHQFGLRPSQAEFNTSFLAVCVVMLIDKLEEVFKLCKEDMMKASEKVTMSGLLQSIWWIFRKRSDTNMPVPITIKIIERLMALLIEMKDFLIPFVSADAPEGLLLEDDDMIVDAAQVKSQMLLSNAWQSLKRLLVLMSSFLSMSLKSSQDLVNAKQVATIGDCFFDVFIRSKHKGVFEQAHPYFTEFCKELYNSKKDDLMRLPRFWWTKALNLCVGLEVDTRLCSTRRSAGLPFLILSLVLSNSKDFFAMSMELLLAHVRDDVTGIHCLNVLRLLVKNSKLSDSVAIYAEKLIMATLPGFASKVWGIRNSSTLLFSALIQRMFGVCHIPAVEEFNMTNKMPIRVFDTRYPLLLDSLLKTLSRECNGNDDGLKLQPILLILGRLYNYASSIDDVKFDHLTTQCIACLNICAASPSYRTRDLAASTIVSLVSPDTLPQYLATNFKKISLTNTMADNERHGLLLQVSYLLRSYENSAELPIGEYLNCSMGLLTEAGRRLSHLTVSLYMEIVTILLIRFNDLDILKGILVAVSRQDVNAVVVDKSTFAWNRFSLLLCLLLNKFAHVPETFDAITRQLLQNLYSPDGEMKKKVLQLLVYLNQRTNAHGDVHPIFATEAHEIPQNIKFLVDSFSMKDRKRLLAWTHPYLKCVFYGELKRGRDQISDDLMLVFILLPFYPCVFAELRLNQEILDFLLNATKCDNEEIIAAILHCIRIFIRTLDKDTRRTLKYGQLIKVMLEAASAGAAPCRRLSVAELLTYNQDIYKRCIGEYDRYNWLNLMMMLLEDNDILVRNTMAKFTAIEGTLVGQRALWPVIGAKARADLMRAVVNCQLLENDMAICFLTSWMLRALPEEPRADVASKSVLNPLAENVPIFTEGCKVLMDFLWPLGAGLHYDDNSIFLEEQTLLVSNKMLTAISKYPSPFVDKRMKASLLVLVKTIIRFLENADVNNDFPKKFRDIYNQELKQAIQKTLKGELYRIEDFFLSFYEPVLNTNSRFLNNRD